MEEEGGAIECQRHGGAENVKDVPDYILRRPVRSSRRDG